MTDKIPSVAPPEAVTSLAGRVAIVTGGARGIGEAITRSLAAGGAHVAAGYHNDKAAAEALQHEMLDSGWSVSIHQGSVGDPADCQRVVSEVLESHGQVDIVVNNAGITVDKTVRKMTIEDWHAVLRINLSGAFYMTKAVLDHMLERGYGRIVNITSLAGQTGHIGQANYVASKAGLHGFSQSLAMETARKGITVNCVAPGWIETEMAAAIPKEMHDGIAATIPVLRMGRPSEVARLVRFLVDDDSGYITGALYGVDGGLHM